MTNKQRLDLADRVAARVNQDQLRKGRTAVQQKYLASGGVRCPNCGSDDIRSTESVEVTDGGAVQDCECDICFASWTDIYQIVGIANLEVEED